MNGSEIRWFGHTLSPDLPYLELYDLSDVHYGSQYCDVKLISRQLAYVADNPYAFIILGGDWCESVLRSSVGDIYQQVGTPQDQRDWCIEMLYPIKDKILGSTTGNHERRITNDTGIDISKDIADALSCPYDPDGLWLKISFGDGNNAMKGRPFTYWVYADHGYGGARTKGAKIVKLERLASWVHADVYCQSHDHDVVVSPIVYLEPDPRGTKDSKTGFTTGAAIAHRKQLVKTSAYLRWGGYARQKGHSPVDLITPTIWLAGKERPWPDPRGKENRKPEVRVVS